MKLARAAEMQAIDRTAIEEVGIPGVVLMENAGRRTVELLVDRFGEPRAREVAVFAGPGNNGGDGFVVARHLQQRGGRVIVYLLVAADRIKGDAAVNMHIARRLGIPIRLVLDTEDLNWIDLTSCYVVVDAIFGTGLTREVGGHFAEVVNLINAASCPVVAVDMPTGLDSDTGKILGRAVKADLTATYGLGKPGQFVYPGREHTGELRVIDIGIPAEVVEQAGLSVELLAEDRARDYLPDRSADSHKGTYGHVLVVAGSTGKTGAAVLSGLGALRSGAGLVSLCVGQAINSVIESALYEAMTIPVRGGIGGAPVIADFEHVLAALEGKEALVMGPGIGTSPETAELVLRLYEEAKCPLVVDADALNILAAREERLTNRSGFARILTPHPGEMARLCRSTSREVQENRIETAAAFSRRYEVYLVLKGAGTLVAAPDGRLAVNPSGNAGMAAGGMGDVLSGILGGFLAQGQSVWQAACLGVYLHGRAGDMLMEEKGPWGYLAAEVAQSLPCLLKTLSSK